MSTEDEAIAEVRALVRAADRAALGTNQRDPAGYPYTSLVMLATDHDGSPVLMLSDLADHTRNLKQDQRASLLIDGTRELDDPLAGARVTLLGRIARTEADAGRGRFLRRHPSAALYAGFGDFAVYRFATERAHLVAGFGRIRWLEGAVECVGVAPELVTAEAGLVARLNDGLGRSLGLLPQGWIVTGIDGAGIDLRSAGKVARVRFPEPVASADEVLDALPGLALAV